MACVNSASPLQLPWTNVPINPDGTHFARGVAVQIGTPSEVFSLRPGLGSNNTFVFDIINCESLSNETCVASFGGLYDPLNSHTFSRTTWGNWNGSHTLDAEVGGPYVYFNDDIEVANGVTIDGYPLYTDNSKNAQRQGGLPMGRTSTFVDVLVSSGLAPSTMWSLWPGSAVEDIDGMWIIGGKDEDRYTGELSAYESYWNCPVALHITNVTYNTDQGSTSLANEIFWACGDPFYDTIELPLFMYENFQNATGGVYNGTLDRLIYSSDNLPTGNLTITLSDGYTTTIPSSELFTLAQGWEGSVYMTESSSNPTVAQVQFAGTKYLPWFGIPFLTMNYLVMDFANDYFFLGPANRQPYDTPDQAGKLTTLCTPPPASTTKHSGPGPTKSPRPVHAPPTPAPSSPSHTDVGAIVGGVVGGVLGLALIAAVLIIVLRRQRRRSPQPDPDRQSHQPGPAYPSGVPPSSYTNYPKSPLSVTTDTAHTETSELGPGGQNHVKQWLSATSPLEGGPGPHEVEAQMTATSGPVEMPVHHYE